MLRVKLNSLTIENFKGIKTLTVDVNGEDAIVKAENGIGKTTIYDAFLWLLFDKDSAGRKDFDFRPLDRRNNPLKGVVVGVEAEIEVGGVSHVFRKEQHEKIVKNQIRGYEAACWIDDVPKKVGEYSDYITEIISEENFKLLTDLHFFNSKLHWTDRRKVLLEIVGGEIQEPEGFDHLREAMNGRSLDEFKKVLTAQKKLYVKERAEINPRIDEILKGLEHPLENAEGLTDRRDDTKKELEKLKIIREAVNGEEVKRAAINTKITTLTRERTLRESGLANDMSGVQKLLESKSKLATAVATEQQMVQTVENEINVAAANLAAAQSGEKALMKSLQQTRDKQEEIEKAPSEVVCYACGQKLPAGKVKALSVKRQEELDVIEKRGGELLSNISEQLKAIDKIANSIALMDKTLEQAEMDLRQTQGIADAQVKEIDEQIKNRPSAPPETDEHWMRFNSEIKQLESDLGPSAEDQLTALETKRQALQDVLNRINEELAQADRMVKDRARINELEEREKVLAQAVADCEKQLADINQYKADQSNRITEAVNKLFKRTKFKMFKELLNGELEECCEATLDGVPYSVMSTGEGMSVGVDINNVLADHHGYLVPLFIDHAESLSIPLDTKSQTIKLFMCKGIKQLQIESFKGKVKVG